MLRVFFVGILKNRKVMSRINKKDGIEKIPPNRFFGFREYENSPPKEPGWFKKSLRLPDYNFIVPWQLNQQPFSERKMHGRDTLQGASSIQDRNSLHVMVRHAGFF